MTGFNAGTADRETAYAKINLALHVRKRLPNGYHELETIFAFLDQGDIVAVEAGDDISLAIEGPFAAGLSARNNLVTAAASRLADAAGIAGKARLHLDKRLPVASGIGGGSADAAAALRLLNRFWGLDLSVAELAEIGQPLGADVPACLFSRTCTGAGIGQDLTMRGEEELLPYSALLINPLVLVATPDIFAAWDGSDRGGLNGSNVIDSALAGRNDLQPPAVQMVPVLADILAMLEDSAPVIARMSGSGATCFALFEDRTAAIETQRRCRTSWPGMWTMVGGFR